MKGTPFDVMRTWMDMMNAINAWDADLRRCHGLGGMELGLMRIIDAGEAVRMGELRQRLRIHPATFGQAVDRLVKAGWMDREIDPRDRRARILCVTEKGRELLCEAPVAGPAALLFSDAEPERLGKVADAFKDAVELFRLEPWMETTQEGEDRS